MVDPGSATESTRLVDTESVDSANTSVDSQQQLIEELDKPWPSTFSRSISLLSSPVLPVNDVEEFTKSPKPGSSPAILARRRNLNRGYYTPEPNAILPPVRRHHSDRDVSADNRLVRNQSLDLGLDMEIQAQRMEDAKRYRENILKKQRQTKSSRPSKKKADSASFSQCVFNLANILMGVGLLGLPYVFKMAGWYGGLLCLIALGAICWRTAILIGRELNGDPRPSNYFKDSPYKSPLLPGSSIQARMLPPISSFPEIARSAFGNTGSVILASILYFELFSCISIFFVSMGDHLSQLFPSVPSSTHTMVVAGFSMVPTIVLRTPALLSYLSMVGTLATIAVVTAVIHSAFSEGDISQDVAADLGQDSGGPYHVSWRPEGLSLAFGLTAYCFSGHAIVPSIYTSMEKPQDFERMVTLTFIVVVACCIGVGIAGYYMFGSNVEDQITLSLESHSEAVLAMKALTWLMILTGTFVFVLLLTPTSLFQGNFDYVSTCAGY